MATQTIGGVPNPRKSIYAEVLSRVREVLIGHMAKPEEVLIEEDDSGEIVRGESGRIRDGLATLNDMGSCTHRRYTR